MRLPALTLAARHYDLILFAGILPGCFLSLLLLSNGNLGREGYFLSLLCCLPSCLGTLLFGYLSHDQNDQDHIGVFRG